MSSKKKDKKNEQQEQEQPAVTESPGPEATLDTPSQATTEKLSVKSLFLAYDESEAALERAKTEFDLASHTRSRAVKAIMDATGSKGPFKYKGNIVTIVSRTTKNAAGDEHTVYFFKGQRQGVQEID